MTQILKFIPVSMALLRILVKTLHTRLPPEHFSPTLPYSTSVPITTDKILSEYLIILFFPEKYLSCLECLSNPFCSGYSWCSRQLESFLRITNSCSLLFYFILYSYPMDYIPWKIVSTFACPGYMVGFQKLLNIKWNNDWEIETS